MGPGPAGVLAYASALTASLAAIFTYLLAGLRSRVLAGPHVNVNLTLSAPNAAALASASLTTYMAWLVKAPPRVSNLRGSVDLRRALAWDGRDSLADGKRVPGRASAGLRCAPRPAGLCVTPDYS